MRDSQKHSLCPATVAVPESPGQEGIFKGFNSFSTTFDGLNTGQGFPQHTVLPNKAPHEWASLREHSRISKLNKAPHEWASLREQSRISDQRPRGLIQQCVEIFAKVRATGVPNFRGVRIKVPSALNIEAWRNTGSKKKRNSPAASPQGLGGRAHVKNEGTKACGPQLWTVRNSQGHEALQKPEMRDKSSATSASKQGGTQMAETGSRG